MSLRYWISLLLGRKVHKIRITQKDIDHGRPTNPEDCGIAKALKRHFKTKDVSVGTNRIIINGKRIDTPAAAINFIVDFDCNKKNAKPFTLTIAL